MILIGFGLIEFDFFFSIRSENFLSIFTFQISLNFSKLICIFLFDFYYFKSIRNFLIRLNLYRSISSFYLT